MELSMGQRQAVTKKLALGYKRGTRADKSRMLSQLRQVDIHRRLPDLFAHLERGRGNRDAGVGQHDVETTQLGDTLTDRLVEGRLQR
jgi:hypothetical protein